VERLSGADATFLYTETPRTPMEVATCLVIDTSTQPRGDALRLRVRDHLEARLHLAPPLRRRLVRVPFELDHPVWVEDPHFDLDHHLHHLAMPSPGTLDQLAELIAPILSRPLDRSRPLWEIHLIEGLEGDQGALFVKTHHAAIDGVAGFELLSTLVDLSADAPPPPPPEDPWVPDREPNDLELVTGAVADLARQPLRATRAAARLVTGAVRSQRRGDSPVAALGATSAPRSPFNRRLGSRRHLRFTDLDLGELRAVKEAAGVKLNDVVLAVVGGALRRYLLRLGELPDRSLVAFVPVTLRTGDAAGANLTSVVYVELATDEDDPARRLARVAAAATDAKAAHAELGPPALVDLTELTGPAVGSLVGRLWIATRFNERTRMAGNVVVSNIPGIDVPLYAGGAEVRRILPVGPVTDGTGLNLTMLSYRDRLELSVFGDRDAIVAPDRLVEDLHAAHEELRSAIVAPAEAPPPAGRTTASSRRRRTRPVSPR
jgi:diacylglycerol O-acyltransferase